MTAWSPTRWIDTIDGPDVSARRGPEYPLVARELFERLGAYFLVSCIGTVEPGPGLRHRAYRHSFVVFESDLHGTRQREVSAGHFCTKVPLTPEILRTHGAHLIDAVAGDAMDDVVTVVGPQIDDTIERLADVFSRMGVRERTASALARRLQWSPDAAQLTAMQAFVSEAAMRRGSGPLKRGTRQAGDATTPPRGDNHAELFPVANLYARGARALVGAGRDPSSAVREAERQLEREYLDLGTTIDRIDAAFDCAERCQALADCDARLEPYRDALRRIAWALLRSGLEVERSEHGRAAAAQIVRLLADDSAPVATRTEREVGSHEGRGGS
jgi:hypothetical protein